MAQAISGENYEFQAQPQVVKPKPKYRPQQVFQQEDPRKSGSLLPSNIMFDKRVIRGNTYANLPTQGEKKLITMKQFKKPQPKAILQPQTQYLHPTTPKPFHNRHNIEIQTDDYVETLTDKPPEQDMEAQTDFYIDKPPERLFRPKKNGNDRDTQIWEGDLFDFDQEVEPILQVLMNKIFEQSRMEVLEEEEMKLMKLQQKEHERNKNSVLSEMQRLEQVQIRLDQEEQRRRLQYETVVKQQILSHQKIVSRQIAKNLINPLKERTFKKLEYYGYFRDPLNSAILSDFFPWVFDNVLEELKEENSVHNQFDDMLIQLESECSVEHRNSIIKRKQFIQDYYDEIERKKQEKEEQKRLEEERRLKEIEDERIRLEEEARALEEQQNQQQDDQQAQQQ